MDKRIIFPTDDDGVAVLIPGTGWDVSEVARKDVPAGVPYRIVDESDIPSDRSEREQWTADFSRPDGRGIGADAWFSEQEAKRLAEEEAARKEDERLAAEEAKRAAEEAADQEKGK